MSKTNEEILTIWDMLDDGDKSTEFLVALTADYAGVDEERVYDALISRSEEVEK